MAIVQQLLDEKGHDVYTIGPGDTVFDAIRKMAERNIGAVLVMEDGDLTGIFTERDYSRNVFLKGKASPTTPVRDVMSADPITVGPHDTVEACMEIMTTRAVRHLPVEEDGKVVGMISIGDLVKNIISEQRSTIEQLKGYIAS